MKSNIASARTIQMSRLGLCLGLAVVLTGLVIASFGTVRAQEQSLLAAPAFDRSEDPVVITGTRFPAFSGAPLNELVVYAYRSGAWAPVPFQIDEVNISGTFVTNDDGLLGSRDELVFMAGDAADSVSAAEWPVDTQARLNSRYAITVTDPLSASQEAWVYLYRLLRSPEAMRVMSRGRLQRRPPQPCLTPRPLARRNLWGCRICPSTVGMWIFSIDRSSGGNYSWHV